MQEAKLQTFIEKAEEFLKVFDRLEKYKQFCISRITEADRTLSDLDHKLELVGLDGVKMMQLISRRKQLLQDRRIHKDELDRIHTITSKIKDTQSLHNQIQAACTELRETNCRLSSRKYTPKVLYEDFGISEDEKKKIEQRKSDIQKLSKTSKSGRVYKPSKKQLDLEEKFREVSVM